MIGLSARTEALAARLFRESERAEVRAALERDVAEEIPGCAGQSPEEMERIRFAVLKLAAEGRPLAECVELARVDWRDLFVAAGFAEDVRAHEVWADGVLG